METVVDDVSDYGGNAGVCADKRALETSAELERDDSSLSMNRVTVPDRACSWHADDYTLQYFEAVAKFEVVKRGRVHVCVGWFFEDILSAELGPVALLVQY